VWRAWDGDHGLRRLHPTHPPAYDHVARQAFHALPPALLHRVAQAGDLIGGVPQGGPGLTRDKMDGTTVLAGESACYLELLHRTSHDRSSRVRVDSLALLVHGDSPVVPC
jgi:hypothetical protein